MCLHTHHTAWLCKPVWLPQARTALWFNFLQSRLLFRISLVPTLVFSILFPPFRVGRDPKDHLIQLFALSGKAIKPPPRIGRLTSFVSRNGEPTASLGGLFHRDTDLVPCSVTTENTVVPDHLLMYLNPGIMFPSSLWFSPQTGHPWYFSLSSQVLVRSLSPPSAPVTFPLKGKCLDTVLQMWPPQNRKSRYCEDLA